jgi:hypothetical protein
MRVRPIACLVCVLVWPFVARADEPWPLFDGSHWSLPPLCRQWQQRRCWCADDYQPKCRPAPPPWVKGCVDDYCRKALPAPPPRVKGCVDDYCRKTCPLCLGRLGEPWYQCGPPEKASGGR